MRIGIQKDRHEDGHLFLDQTDYSAFSSLTSLASSTGCSFLSFLPNANGTGAPLIAATKSRTQTTIATNGTTLRMR